MDDDDSSEYECERVDRLSPHQEVWVRAWCAYAAAGNSVRASGAKSWADRCLKEYRETFPQ